MCRSLCIHQWLTMHETLNSEMNVGHSNGLPSNRSSPSFRSDCGMTDFTSLFRRSPSPLQSRCTHDTFKFSFSSSLLRLIVWIVLQIGEWVSLDKALTAHLLLRPLITFLITFKVTWAVHKTLWVSMLLFLFQSCVKLWPLSLILKFSNTPQFA